jgi:hypothetical protein
LRVIICGSRNWKDEQIIKDYILNLPHDAVVITGGCRGADMIANIFANRYGFGTIVCNADWNRYGCAAGPIRNLEMLTYKPDVVMAFHDDYLHSKGTLDMITKAKQAGVPVEVITSLK